MKISVLAKKIESQGLANADIIQVALKELLTIRRISRIRKLLEGEKTNE